jgi:predicted CopG family antitoxin
MIRKLNISITEQVYNDLYKVAGKRNVSKFIEKALAPHLNSLEISKAKLKERVSCLNEKEIKKINLLINKMLEGKK